MKTLSKMLVFIGILTISFSCSKVNDDSQEKKVNEVHSAFWNLTGATGAHDPCIIKEGSTWWVFTTGTGIPVKYSSNGLAWTQGIQRFGSELSWWRTYAPTMGTNDVWAPMCYYYGGRYWLYYSVSVWGTRQSAIGLTSCTSITTGDWRDDGVVLYSTSSSAYNAIDPNICADASGNLWMSFGSWNAGIYVIQLSTSTMKPTGSATKIAYKSGGIEGSCIQYYSGYYYLFNSYGVCCQGVNSTYKIGVGRATSITGTYYAQNGTSMLSGGYTLLDGGNTRWIGPGGQTVYKNGSSYILIRHAYDALNNGAPTMLINDLYFTSGWPTY